MSDQAENGAQDADPDVEREAFARHHRLSIALPFPHSLEWSTCEEITRSLDALYDYAEDLATSVIDWYLTKKRGKRRLSVGLRYSSYAFATAGVAFPLVKIFNPKSMADLLGPVASDISDIAVEAALVLIAIAGGLHAFDRLVGASSAWMRYIVTAIRLSRRLQRFRFDWNELKAGSQFIAPNPAAPKTDKSADASSSADARTSKGQKFDLIRAFCSDIAEVVAEETGNWATEITNNVAQFEKHLSSLPLHRPPDQ
jgi:hypothetical protein